MPGKINVVGGKNPTGNAQPLDVLEAKTFMSADGEQIGTMRTFHSGAYFTSNITRAANALYLSVPTAGYYGTGAWVKYTENDWTPENIKAGVNMFGKVGTLQERKKQTGTVSSGSVRHNFINAIDGTAEYNYYVDVVCAFVPTSCTILGYAVFDDDAGVAFYDDSMMYNGVKPLCKYPAGGANDRLKPVITGNTIRMPVPQGSTSWRYVAYG